jgi:hypothetical protein
MHCPNCRSAVPAGSRFCNGCGAQIPVAAPPPTGRPVGRPAPPPHARTNMGGPSVPTMMPHAAAAAAGAPARKKPMGALIFAISALVALLIISGVVVAKARSGQPVFGGSGFRLPWGPGTTQAAGTDLPPGPGVVGNTGFPLVPGAPVTGATKNPDGMSPSVLIAPGSQPRAGSSVVTVQPTPLPPGPGVMESSGPNGSVGSPVTSGPKTPEPDNADFDRYLRWLQYVENQRAGLRAEGETESFRVIDQFYQTALGLSDPDADNVAENFDRNIQDTLIRTQTAMRNFRENILRTKPRVPADCMALDQYYLRAVELEAEQTAKLMEALARKDIGRIRSVGKSGVGSIDVNLGLANKCLEQVYRQRGLNQQFRIETGGNSSLLGGLMGLGGMH